MGAEAREANLPPGAALPLIQSFAHRKDTLPERPSSTRCASPLDLDHGGSHFDHAGVKVHGAAGRKVVRGAFAVHQRAGQKAARIAEYVLGAHLLVVHQYRELGLHADGGQLDTVTPRPFFRGAPLLG